MAQIDLYEEIKEYLDTLLWERTTPAGRENSRRFSEAIHYIEWALDYIEVCEDYESAADAYAKARAIISEVA